MSGLKLFSIGILTLVWAACGPVKEPQADLLEPLFGNHSGGLFRNHAMGDGPAEVLASESSELVLKTDSALEYRAILGAGKEAVPIDLYYTFDDYGLFEIQVDLFPSHAVLLTQLEQALIKRLTGSFGEPLARSPYLWTTTSKSNRRVEISLSADTSQIAQPFISLNFLELLDDEL